MSVDELLQIVATAEGQLTAFEVPAPGPGAGETVNKPNVFWPLPPSNRTLATPCFINLWRPVSINRGGNGLRRDLITITVQYLQCEIGAGTNLEVNGRKATIAFDRFMDELDRHIGPGRSNHQASVTGTSDPAPVGITRNEVQYLGWEIEIGFDTVKEVSYATGD